MKTPIKSVLVASLDTFTRAYLECALWSSNDNSTPSGGEPLDRRFSVSDFTHSALWQAKADCLAFQAEHAQDLSAVSDLCDSARAGQNFWLNRNRHGAGFWDEVSGGHELEATFDRLSDASKAAGSCDATCYGGKVHLS